MNMNDGLTADQIIERIANANGISFQTMHSWMELALDNIWNDTAQTHSFMLNDLFPSGKPTIDAFVVALEHELYDAMIPQFEGWDRMEQDIGVWIL